MAKCQHIGQFILETTNTDPFKATRKSIQNTIKQHYKSHWGDKIKTEAKMRSYIKFKTHFNYETYLDSLQFQHRKSLSRFRISAHNLPIERGRYTRPKTPEEDRTCPNCPSEIGNEIHFLTDCKDYKAHRDATFSVITAFCPNFPNLQSDDQLIYLMNSEGEILKEIAKFIHAHLP